MNITAIQLRREHRAGRQYAVVLAEIGGKWIELIREQIDSNFSHIIEQSGINKAAASGGIVEAP